MHTSANLSCPEESVCLSPFIEALRREAAAATKQPTVKRRKVHARRADGGLPARGTTSFLGRNNGIQITRCGERSNVSLLFTQYETCPAGCKAQVGGSRAAHSHCGRDVGVRGRLSRLVFKRLVAQVPKLRPMEAHGVSGWAVGQGFVDVAEVVAACSMKRS
jgi:hypothetical protein